MRFFVVLFALVAVAVAAPASSKTADSGTAKKRSIIAYGVPSTVYSGVNLQSSPTLVASAPVEYAVVSEPARTLAVGPSVYGTQSRVNLHQSPAVVSYSSPVLTQQVVSSPAVVGARAVYSPVATAYSAPSAVSYQSQVDIHSSPALVSQNVVSPAVYEARNVYSPSVYSSYW